MPTDVTGSWGEPEQRPDGSWIAFVTYPTGVTLSAGESLTVALTMTVPHVVPEVFNPAGGGPAGQPLLGSGSSTFTCTVTGV